MLFLTSGVLVAVLSMMAATACVAFSVAIEESRPLCTPQDVQPWLPANRYIALLDGAAAAAVTIAIGLRLGLADALNGLPLGLRAGYFVLLMGVPLGALVASHTPIGRPIRRQGRFWFGHPPGPPWRYVLALAAIVCGLEGSPLATGYILDALHASTVVWVCAEGVGGLSLAMGFLCIMLHVSYER